MAYKLKAGPSQSLKLKGNAGFALPIIGGVGVAAAKSGGVWTVSLDYEKMPAETTVNDTTAYIMTWDSATDLFRRISVTDFKAEFEDTFDGVYQPLDATLTALAALDSTAGLLVQTGEDTFERRTLTGTANEITVTNGDGTAGDPTLSLPAALTFTGKTVTGGTFAGAVSYNKIAITAPATGATLTIADGKTLTVSNNATVSGTNAGDQTITLTGDVTGTGTGSFAATIGATKVTSAMLNADVFSTAHSWSGVQTFTDPVANTQSPSDNSTKIATTAYVDAQVSAGVAGVSSLNGETGALTLMVQPQGRLTLTSATPVMAASVAGATTVYYTPAVGNQIPLYDGTNFVPTTFTELSQATTDATKSPAAVTTSSNYDVFVWDDSGTIRATRGPAWSSSTARGTGAGTTELELVNGVYLNKVSITNGPAANRGTYVGTIRSNGSSTIDFIYGAQGTAAVLGVWNNYNRVQVSTSVSDATASWTYGTFAIRQSRASAVNQVSFVSGLSEECILASANQAFALAATSGAVGQVGLALDSTSTFDKYNNASNNAAVALTLGVAVSNAYKPQLGYHYISMNENGDGVTTTTFVGQGRQSLCVTTFM